MGPGNRRRESTDKIPHREDELTCHGALRILCLGPPDDSSMLLSGFPFKFSSISIWSTQFLTLPANKNTAARLFLYFSILHSGAKTSRFKSKTFQVVSESILVRQMQGCTRFLMRHLSLLRPNVHCSALILVALLITRESERGGIS
jgi:hypothetical protein